MSKTPTTTTRCGFCVTGNHETCRPAVRRGDWGVWLCGCTDESHENRQPHCLECKSVEAVDPETWRCLDVSECQARVESRLAKDPLIQFITKCREEGRAEKIARRDARRETDPEQPQPRPRAAREPKKPQPCRCGCGETTGGGKFRPGHDAKLASRLRARIKEGDDTARQEMIDLGWEKKLPKTR